MRIAFIGDMHGRAFHALAAVLTMEEQLETPFDLILQVGDFGYPDPARADAPTQRYLAVDPAEADLARLLAADGERAEALSHLRARLPGPIHFLRGNHEDFSWLQGLLAHPARGTAPADPFDLFHYVADGTVLDIGGLRIAFLGGVEELPGEAAIDVGAHQALLDRAAGAVDLLVTHEGPFGSSRGYHGDVHGSALVTRLIETLQPSYHVFGHAHQILGPGQIGRTTYLGVDGLVASPIWHPEASGLKPGCLATLDTATGELQHVTDEWLASFPTPFDFDAWAGAALLAD